MLHFTSKCCVAMHIQYIFREGQRQERYDDGRQSNEAGGHGKASKSRPDMWGTSEWNLKYESNTANAKGRV